MHQEMPHELIAAVTGVPIVPPGIEDLPLGPETIRGFACNALLETIRTHFPRSDPQSGLTAEQLAELRQLPKVKLLGAELRAANDTLANWHRPPAFPPDAEGADTPRGLIQARAIGKQVEHAQQAPLRVYDPRSPYRDGLLTVAPQGIGKTLLQAILLNYAGIGEPISDVMPQRRTAVGIIHANVNINQQLDPDETLQRFINIGGRTVYVGAYDQNHRDGHDEYDYLLTTPASYATAVEKGAIKLDTTIRFVLDEAHRTAMAPRMQQHVDAFGPGLYMYTATPAIARGRRDLRKRFPYMQEGSMREYVQDGILSPFQLFTYRAGPEADSAERIAIREAIDLVESGRKTLVVCQRGEQMKQARDIANHINHLYRTGRLNPHPRFRNMERDEIACAIGTSDPSLRSEESIRRFRKGDLLLLTSVATGNDALNIIDLDGLVLIGPQGAQWIVDQWVGRLGRPSGQIAIAAEILPHILREGRSLASIFRTFDLEDKGIQAGYYIGPYGAGHKAYRSERLGRLALGTGTTYEEDAAANVRRRWLKPKLYTPPPELKGALLNNVSIREATIAPADLAKLPPPDYKPLDINLPEGVPITFAYGILSKLDDPEIRYVAKREEDADGKLRHVRYYSPAAHQYFEENPISEIASKSEFSRQDMADLLGVHYSFIMRTIARLKLKSLPNRMTARHRQAHIYDINALAKVAAEVEKRPVADVTDVPIRELETELGISGIVTYMERYGIKAIDKRRNPFWGIAGISMHITAAEAHFLREVRTSVQQADPALHISYAEITERAGLDPKAVAVHIERLPEDKRPIFGWMTDGPTRPGRFADRKWGEAFIEYIKPEKVLPWEVTGTMLAEYFGRAYTTIQARLKDVEVKRISLPRITRTVPIYPMSVIPRLVGKGLKPYNAPLVNAKLAALAPEDMENEKRIAYSQRVQRLFLRPEHIPKPEEVAYYYRRRQKPPTLPDPVPLNLPFSAIPTPSSRAAKGKKHSAAPPSIPSIEITEGHVHLQQYLAEQDVACAPNMLLLLARQNHIDSKQWQYTNKGIFTSEDDASTLALAIMDYDTAPPVTGDPMLDQVAVNRIAAEYSGAKAQLSDGDVHKVAVRILQQRSLNMEDFVTPLRYRLPDGKAGPLVMHYKKKLAVEVRKELDRLKVRGQLATIRRW